MVFHKLCFNFFLYIIKTSENERYLNEKCFFFKKKFFPIKTAIFVRKENSYYTMNYTVEDLSLLNDLRQGDGNAFDHLFRRYYPMLCVYSQIERIQLPGYM